VTPEILTKFLVGLHVFKCAPPCNVEMYAYITHLILVIGKIH
jgi:hypothetical protein